MDRIFSQLIREYNINAVSVKKIRGFYAINTVDGKYSLKKTADTPSQLMFQIQIQQKLEEAAIINFEKIYFTKDNAPCTQAEGINYILTDYIEGNEADFDKEEHIDGIIEMLANFHEYGNGGNKGLQLKAEDLRLSAKKYYDEITAIKKKLDLSKGLSGFDMLFLKNCDYYINNAKKCEEILDAGSYLQKFDRAVRDGKLCHNLLKKENIIVKNNKFWLASFSKCSLDYYTTDLAMIIERYIKYSKNKNLSAVDIINKYSKHFPVDCDDYAIIFAALLLPAGFAKTLRAYYAKKRSWAPTSITAKMEAIVSTKATTEEYLKPLAEIVK